MPASQPGYASLQRDEENNANGYSKLHGKNASETGLYSKLDRRGTGLSQDSSLSVEYSKLERSAFPQDSDVRIHSPLLLATLFFY